MHSIPIDPSCNLNVLKCVLFLFVRCSFSSMLRTGLGMHSQLSFSNLNLPQSHDTVLLTKKKKKRKAERLVSTARTWRTVATNWKTCVCVSGLCHSVVAWSRVSVSPHNSGRQESELAGLWSRCLWSWFLLGACRVGVGLISLSAL